MSSSTQQPDVPAESIHAVQFTLPDFWQHASELYFIRIESAFYSANITKELSKYHKLVEVLPANIISQVQPFSGRTFYVCDNVTRRRFLVDTGAQISVVPPTPVDRRCPSPGLHLQAANCSPISTFGSRSLTLNIGLRRLFSWIFVIADVHHSILGSDFLAEFDLRVDCRRSCLLDRTTGLSVRGLTPFNDSCNLSVLDTVFARPRRLAASRLQAAKAEFEHMLQLGIIRPSENPWASPLHMVPRATSDDWRPCGNYRALNNATMPDRYPVPHLQDFAGALFGK
ncbi:hypothetical protein SprV_0702415000 [Sparganum proliferum]